VIGQYIGHNINNLTTFGVVTNNGNQAYSIDAFKPAGIAGNDWVITDITPHALTVGWVAP
jgi:hypothetical protein